eukprot:SAG11_NODE_2711_length_3056_cov_1.984782_5_plen_97_part_00
MDLSRAADGEAAEDSASVPGVTVPRQYPLWATTHDDLGVIGGVGLQLYFGLLRGLWIMFGVLGLVNLPPLILNLYGEIWLRSDITPDPLVRAKPAL